MPPALKACLFDTSALLCLREDEEGAQKTAELLKEAGEKNRAFVSFMTLMEYCYVIAQKQGAAESRRAYFELRHLPLVVIESDEELGLMAARIKATTKLSTADAWIAATAQRLGAILVHKDPEFETLKSELSLLNLPYKTKRN